VVLLQSCARCKQKLYKIVGTEIYPTLSKSKTNTDDNKLGNILLYCIVY